jgi:hypothetical protein
LSRRTAGWVAWSLCGLTLVGIACAVLLAVANSYAFRDLIFLLTETSAVLVGGLIASRQPRNPVGWLIIGHALCFTLGEFGRQYAIYGVLTDPGSLPLAGAMASPAYWAWFPGLMLVTAFLPLYFPDGHLVSRRWRPVAWLALLVTACSTAFAVIRPSGDETRGLPNPLGIESLGDLGTLSRVFEVVLTVSWVLVGLLSVASLVVRFLRAHGVERQQVKWVAYAAMFFIFWAVLAQLLQNVHSLAVVDEILFVASLQGLWIATGVAVLRYRLYDVDLVVNRALVYTVITTLLVIIYFVAVAAFQMVLRPLPGDESQLAVVASTLAIAAVFNPLRIRMQELIDRRFYHRKYDARKTLEAFSHKLREETDLDRLGGELVSAVQETMQPQHASLWLRPVDESGRTGGDDV